MLSRTIWSLVNLVMTAVSAMATLAGLLMAQALIGA